MAADARLLVSIDKRFPASLAGEAGKVLFVNSEEDGYDHQTLASQHHNDILGGDATVSANTLTFTPCGCWDSTRTVYLETTGNETVALPTTTGTGQTKYFVFLVRLVADSSHEFRAYATKAAVESDAEVSHYRYRTPWRTLATGVAIQAVLVGNTLAFAKASENRSTQTVTNAYATVDHTDLFDPADILEIKYGCFETSGAAVSCTSSLDSTNVEAVIGNSYQSNLGDTANEAWGPVWAYIPMGYLPFTTARKFKLNTTAANFRLAFRAIKLRL